MNNAKNYHTLVQKFRDFFYTKGWIEVPTQSRLSILAACENPFSVTTFEFNGEVWPLPQTGQMWLEHELLQNPSWPGVFCISTSYRAEENPIPGRHDTIFPMIEFESKGGYADLIALEKEILEYLGFTAPIIECIYDAKCKEYGTDILEHEHETLMAETISNTILLKDFPQRSHPFWNMKKREDGLYNKVDVILYGQETFGSAERSCNVEEMRNAFYSVMDGEYSKKLYQLFGKDRVEAELNQFLSYEFFPRFGGGIGVTRLSRAWDLLNNG